MKNILNPSLFNIIFDCSNDLDSTEKLKSSSIQYWSSTINKIDANYQIWLYVKIKKKVNKSSNIYLPIGL